VRLEADFVVEHLEYRVAASEHDAFIAAFAQARALRLAARGCRSVELSRGRGAGESANEYRARIEWRSASEHSEFTTSEAAAIVERTMAPFERRAHHVDAPIFVGRNAGGIIEGGAIEIDPAVLRRAFGHYPTGVAVITAISPDGPVAMVVSSFTTVSLRPALVAFCAAHTSTTWPLIADARSCCINVLEASQGGLVQKLSAKVREKRFEAVAWSAAPSGAPVLGGVVGWLDCVIVDVRVAGDHDLVLLDVLAHDASPDREPLLFHRSGYRAFASQTNLDDHE
jgi:3-hydroxy-9,10-secoandrosta-1,3,5(10)-triene-9,17-dione monooxygenase reductase component